MIRRRRTRRAGVACGEMAAFDVRAGLMWHQAHHGRGGSVFLRDHVAPPARFQMHKCMLPDIPIASSLSTRASQQAYVAGTRSSRSGRHGE